MSTDTWTYQGRQQHGWFGNGTAPGSDTATGGPLPSDEDIARNAAAVAYTAVGAITSANRTRRQALDKYLSNGGAARLQTLAPDWARALRKVGGDVEEFCRSSLDRDVPTVVGRAVASLVKAASEINPTQQSLRQAAEEVANAVIKSDIWHWSSAMRDGMIKTAAAEPTHGLATSIDPTQAKKQKFVDTYYDECKKAADELDVPVENILGLAALESGWGGVDAKARLAREGNNFFSQHHPAPYESGWIWNEDKTVKVAKFASVADSVRSFVQQYGHLVRSKRDPAEFARALQDAGKYGIKESGTKVAHFVPETAATMRGLKPFVARRENTRPTNSDHR